MSDSFMIFIAAWYRCSAKFCPKLGEKRIEGDYLTNAQGEDVVAGIL